MNEHVNLLIVFLIVFMKKMANIKHGSVDKPESFEEIVQMINASIKSSTALLASQPLVISYNNLQIFKLE